MSCKVHSPCLMLWASSNGHPSLSTLERQRVAPSRAYCVPKCYLGPFQQYTYHLYKKEDWVIV